MSRSYDLRTVRKPEGRTEFGEKSNRVGNIVLLILRQGTPPSAELVGELYVPCHRPKYALYRIFCQQNNQSRRIKQACRVAHGLAAHPTCGSSSAARTTP